MFFTVSSLASLRRSSSAAVAPISWSGWRMVVSAGNEMLANSMSSKPMTETSSGTLCPASRKAVIAPSAEMSLKAMSAVNRLPRCSKSSAAMRPSSAWRVPGGSSPPTELLAGGVDAGQAGTYAADFLYRIVRNGICRCEWKETRQDLCRSRLLMILRIRWLGVNGTTGIWLSNFSRCISTRGEIFSWCTS